jgi:acyl-CoA synthetase (NDP forming)
VRGISLDFCERIGLDIPTLSPATVAALRPIVPTYVPVDNPLDLATAGMGQADIYGQTSRILLADENVGCAIMTMVPGTKQLQLAKAHSLIPIIATETRPIAFVMMGDEVPLEEEFNVLVRDGKIPMFRSPDRAMRAMGHLYAHGKRRLERAAGSARPPSRTIALPSSGTIPEYRAKASLAGLGIAVPRGDLATTLDAAQTIAARIGFPVVMKVRAASLAHKSDIGGVIAGVADAAGVVAAWATLNQRAGATKLDGILVEEMCKPGIEMIVGAKRDLEWGPMVLVGLGGIWTEALGDIRLMPAGLSPAEIEAEMRLLKGARVLGGLRGAPPFDVAAAARVAASLGEAMLGTPGLDEIEINPLVLRPMGEGAVALDALMQIGDHSLT